MFRKEFYKYSGPVRTAARKRYLFGEEALDPAELRQDFQRRATLIKVQRCDESSHAIASRLLDTQKRTGEVSNGNSQRRAVSGRSSEGAHHQDSPIVLRIFGPMKYSQ